MAERHVLYQYASCPFCYRVRQFLEREGIHMETRDILLDQQARLELIEGGGRATVPCLRIERGGKRGGDVRWLYESMDIIDYLRRYRAGASATDASAATSGDPVSDHRSINHSRGSNP